MSKRQHSTPLAFVKGIRWIPLTKGQWCINSLHTLIACAYSLIFNVCFTFLHWLLPIKINLYNAIWLEKVTHILQLTYGYTEFNLMMIISFTIFVAVWSIVLHIFYSANYWLATTMQWPVEQCMLYNVYRISDINWINYWAGRLLNVSFATNRGASFVVFPVGKISRYSGPTFIKPDQLDPWIKDQIKITLLPTIWHKIW